MKITLADLIFGFADMFKSQAGILEEVLNSKLDEMEKRIKRIVVFFGGIVVLIFGVFFIGMGILNYFKVSGAGAYFVSALFFFFVSLVLFFSSRFIK